jgi:hypothetical protein
LESHVKKTITRTAVSVIALLVLIAIGGTMYVLFVDREGVKTKPLPASSAADSSPIPQPVAPAANEPEGVAVVYVTSPVQAGSNSSIMISTNAGSSCTIAVSYNGVVSDDPGLAPKDSNAYGSVSWTWTVAKSAPAGSWPIKVTCLYHGRSGVVLSSLQVLR